MFLILILKLSIMRKLLLVSFFCTASAVVSLAQLKVLPNGNVGVKNTNPARTLHVTGSAVFTSGTTISSFSPYIRGKNGITTASAPEYSWVNDSITGVFHPSANVIGFSTNGIEGMRLIQNGNLLIGGTWDGGAKLSIDAKDRCNQINYSNLSSNWGYAQVSNVNRAYTKSWVVTYNWQERFAVWGNGIVYGYGGFYSGSDSIFKENIDSITAPLEKVLLLRGIRYNLKTEQPYPGDTTTVLPTEPYPTRFGVVAQDVELVVPEAVVTLPDGTKAVSYETIFALLIEAVKKQQTVIDKQNNEISLLKNEINSINLQLITIQDCLNNLPHGLGCGHQNNK